MQEYKSIKNPRFALGAHSSKTQGLRLVHTPTKLKERLRKRNQTKKITTLEERYEKGTHIFEWILTIHKNERDGKWKNCLKVTSNP